jgi:hypothetical protein
MTWAMWIVMLVILGAVILSAFLIRRLVPEKRLGAWANVTSIVGGIATAISLLWAAYTYYASANLQRELSAYSAYQDHMKISIEKPEFANAQLAPKPPKEDSSDEEKKKYEQYQWYVGHALYSFESILEALPDDKGWQDTFKGFIEDHKEYIGSNNFPCTRYSERLQQLVKEQIGRDCSK